MEDMVSGAWSVLYIVLVIRMAENNTVLSLSSIIQLLLPEMAPPISRMNILLSDLSRNTITDILTKCLLF